MASINSTTHTQNAPSLTIEDDAARIAKKVATVQEALPALTDAEKKEYLKRLNRRDSEGKLPLEKAIVAHNFKGFLALILVGAEYKEHGDRLLRLSLEEGQMDIFHKLLLDGVAPKDKTLFSLATNKNNSRAFALLEKYGLQPSESDKITLEKAGEVALSTSDLILFGTACAYWGVRGFTNSEYLASMVHILGGTYALYSELSSKKSFGDRVITALGLAGLELMPATNICMRIWRASSAALSLYRGAKAGAAPLDTVVRSINLFQSLYMLRQTASTEFHENEKLKSVLICRNVTIDDIEYLDTLDNVTRMEWVIQRPFALDCPPVLEKTFPGWNCQNFGNEFRKASLVHHPDRSNGSTIQLVLNAVRGFWRSYCSQA